jgi:hypothetical protein
MLRRHCRLGENRSKRRDHGKRGTRRANAVITMGTARTVTRDMPQ